MAKDYFEDITPPQKGTPKATPASSPSTPVSKTKKTEELPRSTPISRAPTTPQPSGSTPPGDRSIRNIVPPRARPRETQRVVPPVTTSQPLSSFGKVWNTGAMVQTVATRSRWWLWLIAFGTLLLLGTVLLFAFRPTTVTVTPRSRAVVFDASNRYSAYPVAEAKAGALAYSLKTLEFEDSAAVAAEGVERVEEKAYGTITVVNEYSAAPVRLIKNTRFETPNGLVFRVPNTVVVPGKKGTSPGTITTEVYADAAGAEYNVGPIARFTLPGLKSSPDMYTTVYAKSLAPFSGGFIGERPQVAPQTLEKARAEIRARLEEQAAGARNVDSEGLLLPGLYRVSFVSLPHTQEAGGGVRIQEKAVVVYPVFTPESFSETVAKGVAADAENISVRFEPKDTFSVTADASALQALEAGPFAFSMRGEGTIVFEVDVDAFKNALLGREKSAFEAIAASFPGIETARARVSPFWARSFPSDPDRIQVVVEPTAE